MTAFIFLLLFGLTSSTAAAPQRSQQDVPSTTPNLEALRSAPLEPARRASLEEALKSGNYNRAEILLVEEIEKNPKSPQLLMFLGGVFFVEGKYLNTAIAMKKAEAISPLDNPSRFTLAMSYIILNHRDWARPELEKLAQRDPRNALYPYWLARIDYDLGQYDAAVVKLERAIELDSGFARAYDNLGLCYEALGNYDRAIQNYQQAIRSNRQQFPSSPWPPLNLGTLLTKLNRLEEAENCLRESLRYDPKSTQAHFQLGVVLEKQNKYTEAIDQLNQAAKLDGTYPDPHYALARIYRRRGNREESRRALETFQKLKKEAPEQRPR